MRCNSYVLARGDARQMSEGICTLKRSLDAEDAERSRADTTVGSKADENDVNVSGYALVVYHIDDIGVGTHITLGYLPIGLAKRFSDGVAANMDLSLQCGHTARCDYNASVSPGNGHEAGHSHCLDIDSRLIGEPFFNRRSTLAILIGVTGVWSQMDVLPMDRVQLKGHQHIRIPCET